MPTLLLVEDDADNSDAVQEVLRDDGWEVVPVADGHAALTALHEGYRPAVVLLDAFMPRMSGAEFLRRLRATPGLQDLPVVLFSASFVQPLDGVAAVLQKPVTIAELLRTLNRFRI